ncbi:MAG: FkbM family methyltransferase [Gammaproteobacteria bacterium]|nr:MAG: FkbM family methyltransferase [Gammaproteobacteria bacterium]
MRLDTIYRQNPAKVSLIKIDTEGHELAVIRGAGDVLRECGPDILMESVFSEVTGEIERLLLVQGYRFYLIDDDKLEVHPVDTLAPTAPADAPAMGQLNRLVTRRSAQEIVTLTETARSELLMRSLRS